MSWRENGREVADLNVEVDCLKANEDDSSWSIYKSEWRKW
jgi:hypothetical protein